MDLRRAALWQSSPDGNYIENTFTIFSYSSFFTSCHVLDDFPLVQFFCALSCLTLPCCQDFWMIADASTERIHWKCECVWFIWIFLIYLCLHTACIHNGLNLTLFPSAFTLSSPALATSCKRSASRSINGGEFEYF